MFKYILVAEGKVANNTSLSKHIRNYGCTEGSLISASDMGTGAMERKEWKDSKTHDTVKRCVNFAESR